MKKPFVLNLDKLKTLSVVQTSRIVGGVRMSYGEPCESDDCGGGDSDDDSRSTITGTRSGYGPTTVC